jgi:hypothetical protein
VAETRPTPGRKEALLAAWTVVAAYQGGLDELLPVPGSDEAARAFAGVLAIAGLALDEVSRLGGDPAALLRRVYQHASALPSPLDSS